jgi:hypothetical protein
MPQSTTRQTSSAPPLAQPLQRKRRACAAAQLPLQAGAVLCLDGDTGVHREATVFEGKRFVDYILPLTG